MEDEEVLLLVYAVLGLPLYGMYREGNSFFKVLYGVLFPVHLLAIFYLSALWGVAVKGYQLAPEGSGRLALKVAGVVLGLALLALLLLILGVAT